MKFARGSAVVSWLSVLALAVACGSAAPTGLFTDGEASGFAQAGADSAKAGSPAVTLNTAGADSGSSTAGAPGAAGMTATSDGGTSTGGAPPGGAGSVTGSAHSGAPGAGNTGSTAGSGGSNAQAGGSSAGSSGSSAQAGSASAGSAGSSGAGGMPGTGGAGGGSAAGMGCPSAQPAANTGCVATTADSCFYIGAACSCQATNQLPAQLSGQRRWQCYGTPDRCPNVAPLDGANCKLNSGAQCPYPGGAYCACVANGPGIGIGTGNGNGNGIGDEAKWSCQAAMPTCPAAKPLKDMQCSDVRSCAYPDDQCFCDGSRWGCESNN